MLAVDEQCTRGLGTVVIEVPIAAVGLSPAPRSSSKVAARHDIAVPLPQGSATQPLG
ncbi:MAG TPA: hypothetical protein VMU39_10255 [Solirubrobacteraceae bacterium]|nr:hypothetical protein [Solirubrobacteraceae bacterium]